MKIGLLKLYEVESRLRPQYGDYQQMFGRLLAEAGLPVEWQIYEVCAGCLPQTLDECDGYLITGSKHGAYEEHPWMPGLFEFIRTQHAAGRPPLMGVCFGHQAVAQALGGRVEKSTQGWGAGRQTWKMCGGGEWLRPPLAELNLLASHQDQVVELPPAATLLAGSDFCPNAAFNVGEHIFCVQGHPEFVPAFLQQLLEERMDTMPAATWRRAYDSTPLPNDSRTCAVWMANFFAAGRAQAV